MRQLIAGIVVCAAASAAALAAAASDTPQTQQVYLRETQQVTARAQLIYKLPDSDPAAVGRAVEGRAEVVERSQGLVVYEPAAARADLQARPASPVHTTTTATVSWTPARTLPTPHSF